MMLYGSENVPKIPQDVIDSRIDMLDANLTKLLEVLNETRDSERITKVLNAISFWASINKGM